MSVSLRKQRDKPSENRIFKKENKYGNLSIIHHSQRLPKGTFRTAWGGEKTLCMSTGNHQHRPRNWAQIQAHIYAMARMIFAGLDSRLFEMTADTMTFVSITA